MYRKKELNDVIMSLNLDSEVDGILVQMPLPSHLDETAVLELIDPQKDVDGLHPMNAGCLLTNRPGFIPCTPQGVMAMLDSIGCKDLSGKRAVVCGRSNLVGKPVALLLQNRNATVTIVHSKTPDIEKIASQADILIVAMGVAQMVNENWVKEGAVVIDVGINRVNGKLVGDCDFESVAKKASYVSPVPKRCWSNDGLYVIIEYAGCISYACARRIIMEYGLNDIVEMKKEHPCHKSNEWKIIRMGADIRIKCLGCGASVLMPRQKFERN